MAADDPRRTVLSEAAVLHRDHGLGLLERAGYEGEHWLASFAVFMLTDAGLY